MGSKEKLASIISAAHGIDDVGFAQPTGTINSVAALGGQTQYRKYAVVTTNAAHNLMKGQPINISGSTDYDGPTRILRVLSPTAVMIKRGFTITKTGNWDVRTVEGNWEALMPMGADITAANLTITSWRQNEQGGNEVAVDYTRDHMYVIPGGIKRIGIATAGNMRLFRGASVKPSDGQNLSLPTIVGYNPTSAVVGTTIDIIGTNFDPIPDKNAVRFTNGVRANVVSATEEILTIAVPVGTVSGAVAVVTNRGQNATGPTFYVN